MSAKNRTVARVALTLIVGMFSLPDFIFGFYLFICWFRIHTTDVYYVEYPYMARGFLFVSIGVLSLLFTMYGAWRRSFYGLVFAIPIVSGLLTMVYIPDGRPHVTRSMAADANYLSSVSSFFRVWYAANHRFPENGAEFNDALKSGPSAWQNRVKSPPQLSFYSQRGVRLPYEVIIVANASGPRIDDLSSRPGVIYYCVSSDRKSFWATMTALNKDVSHTASLMAVANGKAWVVKAYASDYPVHEK